MVVVVLESAAPRFLGAFGAVPDAMPFVSACAGTGLSCTAAWAVYPESIKGLHSVIRSVHPALDTSAEALARARGPSLASEL